MHDLSLSGEIKVHFPNHAEYVVRNLLITSWGIFEARTTNLNMVKDELPTLLGNGEDVNEHANYTRLIRFFKTEDQDELVKCILTVCCLFLKASRGRKVKYLVLDGTEWELGASPVQLLTLCILWNEVAIPIWWEDLEKIGHSSQEERKDLIIKAIKRYQLRGMVLLADREYIGEDWFTFLREQGIEFVIRLKANIYHEHVNATPGPRQSKLKHMANSDRYGYRAEKNIVINNHEYRYIVAKNSQENPKEPLIYLLSSLKQSVAALRAYRLRWKIETCFKHLKTNGFDLEAMNFKNPSKRKLMMAVVVFLYVLAVQEGFFAIQKEGDSKKNFKNFKKTESKPQIKTLAVSFFRKGVSLLRRKIANFKELNSWLSSILEHLKRPSWCHV
jgi:hypothetical protein